MNKIQFAAFMLAIDQLNPEMKKELLKELERKRQLKEIPKENNNNETKCIHGNPRVNCFDCEE